MFSLAPICLRLVRLIPIKVRPTHLCGLVLKMIGFFFSCFFWLLDMLREALNALKSHEQFHICGQVICRAGKGCTNFSARKAQYNELMSVRPRLIQLFVYFDCVQKSRRAPTHFYGKKSLIVQTRKDSATNKFVPSKCARVHVARHHDRKNINVQRNTGPLLQSRTCANMRLLLYAVEMDCSE